MNINTFFSPRMVSILKLFYANKSNLLSNRDILSKLNLNPTDRQYIDKHLMCLVEISLITKLKTKHEEIGYGNLLINDSRRYFYGLNMRNPLYLELEKIINLIENSTDHINKHLITVTTTSDST